jgi:hypothetical protein
LKPRWEQRQFDTPERDGKLRAVVSSGEITGTLRIDQDAQVYVSRLKAGEQVEHRSRAGRKAYLFVIGGGVSVNGTALAAGDQARMADETELKIQAKRDAELILLDLPEVEELSPRRR